MISRNTSYVFFISYRLSGTNIILKKKKSQNSLLFFDQPSILKLKIINQSNKEYITIPD